MRLRAVPLLAQIAIAMAGASALAQQPEPIPRIGYLSVQTGSPRSPRADA